MITEPYSRSLRVRLVLWSTATVAVLLVFYAVGVYVFLRQSLFAEFDHELQDHLEFEAQMLESTAGGIRLGGNTIAETQEDHPLWVRVHSADGTLLDAEPASAPPPGVRWARGRYTVADRSVIVEVAKSEEPIRQRLRHLLIIMGAGLSVALFGAGVAGFLLAGRALAPAARMAAQARMISADRLHQRLPIENPGDELGQLASVFNEMLVRLEGSFETLRRFTADASHELRTPLTAMRSVGEVALHEARDAAVYREAIGSMLEECDRLARLVDTLLLLSRGDAGRVPLRHERIDLAELAREVVRHLEVLAEEKGQSLSVEATDPVPVWADPLVLRPALINLVDNAVKYTPEGGTVRVHVSSHDTQSVVDVLDTGPGIPNEHRDHIFDRFYRIDSARSRDQGGIGLGLSLVRWAVQATGGQVELHRTSASGSTFRITLPSHRSSA